MHRAPDTYLPRIVDGELDALLHALPAVVLEGAKAVGKTATARRRARTVVALDDPAVQAIAHADPSVLLAGEKPILLDEWQRVPPIWDAVRRAVDEDNSPNQFLLTGSAGPHAAPTHTGAGRIVSVRMHPLALAERPGFDASTSLAALLGQSAGRISGTTQVTLAGYVDELVRSGFPGMRTLDGRALRAQLDGYLQRIVDRDFAEQGLLLRNPHGLVRWMTAYAAATSSTATFETIRAAASAGERDPPAKSTVQPYRDVLERLWIIEPVPAWLPTRNALQRLSQPPKHQLADPALALRLLGLDAAALLTGTAPAFPISAPSMSAPPIPRDGSLLGRLFEALVTQSVRVYAQAAEARVRHLRTKAGEREVDLVVERADGRVLAMEVKLTSAVTDADVASLRWLRDRLGDDLLDAVVVNTGATAYRRADGIAVIPAALLGP